MFTFRVTMTTKWLIRKLDRKLKSVILDKAINESAKQFVKI